MAATTAITPEIERTFILKLADFKLAQEELRCRLSGKEVDKILIGDFPIEEEPPRRLLYSNMVMEVLTESGEWTDVTSDHPRRENGTVASSDDLKVRRVWATPRSVETELEGP